MDKLKNKYEIILGFVTLVISLSAFKEELTKISINTGYTEFTLADYFLYTVIGFSVCLYLYIIENVLRDTAIGYWKIFDYIVRIAFLIFVFILVTPILIILSIISFKIYSYLSSKDIYISPESFPIVKTALPILTYIVSEILVRIIYAERKKQKKEQIEIQQIEELDNATKLFNDGYFSHSILESFKAIESFLYKKIIEKGIRVQANRFPDLVRNALQQGIITQDDLNKINDVRGMRNAAAHTDTAYTKQQAEFSLEVVRELFQKK